MRAVRVVGFEGPAAVVCQQVAVPEGGPDAVTVDVRAAGVAFPDVLHTRGAYQERYDPPFTLGGECSGVVRTAPASSPHRPGDRVAVLAPIGAFAEVVAAPPHLVLPLPDAVPFDEGACLPINYLTAHFALGERAGLRPGETVLVQGAAGGVGTATVQLAAALGARVIAVTSTPEKAALARKVGAHEVVDVVVDPVGGDRFTDSLRSLRRRGGRLLVVGFTAGEIPTVKVNRLLLTNTDVRGVGWAKPAFAEPGFVAAQWRELLPHLRSRALAPPVSAAYPFERAAEALAVVDGRGVLGKVVLHP
jgi:NADPH2:quinone reductase